MAPKCRVPRALLFPFASPPLSKSHRSLMYFTAEEEEEHEKENAGAAVGRRTESLHASKELNFSRIWRALEGEKREWIPTSSNFQGEKSAEKPHLPFFIRLSL